uniref:RNA-directed DNA polymerase n=1 Tax=Fagus sylvatica TaxID=28930 RepID=A0A2N9H208_FAGSY
MGVLVTWMLDESATASTAMTPTAIKTLQRNPRFRSLFNQLGLNPEARTAATEAIMAIAADSGAHCFTAETHASRAFLETTNAITFTDEDMEVQYPDHRRPLYLSATINEVQVRRALVDNGSCINLIPLSTIQAAEIPQKKIQGAPMEIKGFGGVGEYTKGHIQLVLKVGPIVAFTRFHVVDSVVPYHILLGRPWLHKHQLIPSTYHQCVKGRLNGKPIRIAANSAPFDQSESHFVEAALYDEVTPAGEASLAKPIGIPLPKWEEIKDTPGADLRDLLEQKKKRKAEASTSKKPATVHTRPPPVLAVNEASVPEPADAAEPVAADPKISAEEELENIKMFLLGKYDEMPGIDPKLVAHSLNVEPGTRPVVQPMRTFHPEVEAQITQEVKKLLSAGFIKPIQHPRWLSNIVPVKKKNGQIRCCVDFRNLNKACPKDEFPLPNMDLLIDSAAGHAMFSFMDGFSGYNQIFMSPKDAEKTAFRTPIGNFYYTVMPFGLKNAGATYQRTMTAMFHDMMHCEIEDYVDDIVVKSKTRGDHFGILKKCTSGGIDVDPARASAIATMKPPTTHKELKSFLGKLSYIRRFIPGLAAVTSTFAPLLKKGASFHWSTECQRSLRKAQESDNGVEQPIYYVSRTLKDAESRYSGAERSCLALIYASQRLRHYFLAHKVQLMTKSHPIQKSAASAIADLLAQFPGEDNSFITDEVPGEINEVFLAGLADSVWTLRFDGSSTATSAGAGILKYEAYLAGLAIAYEMGIKHLRVIGDSNLVNMPQRNENRYADALATLGSSNSLQRRLPGGVLARCISLKEAKQRLSEIHEKTCGDGGATSLYRRLQRLGYFWPNMSAEAAEVQSQCPTCQFHHNNEEVCATFVSNDWRTPFLEYLLEGILPSNPKDVYRLKRLALRYFVEGGTLFRKGFHGEPLRCLGLSESQMVMKETHAGECGEHQGKKRLYQCLLTLGYYWPYNEKGRAYLGGNVCAKILSDPLQLGPRAKTLRQEVHFSYHTQLSDRQELLRSSRNLSQKMTPWHKEHSDGLCSQDHILRTQARLCARLVPLKSRRNKAVLKFPEFSHRRCRACAQSLPDSQQVDPRARVRWKEDTSMHDVELSDRQDFTGPNRNPDWKIVLKRTKNTPAAPVRGTISREPKLGFAQARVRWKDDDSSYDVELSVRR